MAEVLTLGELNARADEIGRETTHQLQLVPLEGRYGDWDALARKHREMLAILAWRRERLGELQPPSDRADAYRHYLDELDRQLVLERGVLHAAEALRDFTAYRDACRALARAMAEVQTAGRRAGLRATGPTPGQRARTWLTLPWYIVQANRHARAEHRAGRRWD